MNDAALRHLTQADPILGEIIAKVGPCTLVPDHARSPFQALVQAVAHQQLNGKAANTLLARFIVLFPQGRFPTAQEVHDVDTAKLTSIGFSRARAGYVKEIARMALEGVVSGTGQITRMSDDEIIERLTTIKGVGRWTVEMLLIFSLGRAGHNWPATWCRPVGARADDGFRGRLWTMGVSGDVGADCRRLRLP